MYDIIIIGAGPAGATAAKTLAENGRHVLLAEKFRLPRYKSCSGQLIKKSLDLIKRYFGEEVPPFVTCTPSENRGMIFTDDAGRSFCFEQQGLNVWRSSFDAWLTKKAVAAGAILRDGFHAVSCTAGTSAAPCTSHAPGTSAAPCTSHAPGTSAAPCTSHAPGTFAAPCTSHAPETSAARDASHAPETSALRDASRAPEAPRHENADSVSVLFRKADGSTCTEQARYVIDCEGVIGTLKRQLTGIRPDYITTYQTFHRGSIDLDPHYFYAYLQPELSEYDAWFNVKDDLLVLGISVKNKEKERHYHGHFLRFMEKHHQLTIGAPEKCDRWLMPRIKPGCAIDYGVGRVLFAGEAAGFLNPMGEGISAAMESAFCAANAVLQHGEEPAAVRAAYQESTAALHHYMKRQWSLVGTMARTFSEMR